MSKVDWSLASIHATHAGTFEGKFTCWYMLEGGKWFYSGDFGWGPVTANTPIADLEERPKQPQAWSGPEDGLPPVGTVCESMWNESRDEWLKVKVFGANEHGQPIFRWEEGSKKYEYQASPISGFRGNPYFRPIKTPEQLAADKRESAIRELMDIAQVDCRVTAARLVDAGFKREVV